MIKRILFRGNVERPLNGLMWAMLILWCSLFISPQMAKAETCSAKDNNDITIAAGGFHTVGLKEDGTVVAVGRNDYLQQSDVSKWKNIKAVAAGWLHTVGLQEDGTVVAVGDDDNGQTDVNSAEWTIMKIKAIAAGQFHTVGLKEDVTLVGAGDDSNGQKNFPLWTNIKAIAAGATHTVGLTEDGKVVVTGNISKSNQNIISTWTNIKAIAAGGSQTVGLTEDGKVVAVGNTGDVSTWTKIKAIAAGQSHIVGLQDDGTVVAVGSNTYYQTNVSSWKNLNIKAVAAGAYHTVGLKGDGTVVTTPGKASYSQNTTGLSDIKQPTSGIVDNTPPELKISVTPSMLWPPNHQMVTVTPVISVTDNCDPAPQVKLLSVTSSESDNGLGDGDTANDIVQNSDGTISLRAERSGKGSGRVYTITYQTTDASGNAVTATATVTVPHNK